MHVLYLVAGDKETDGAELLMADGDSALGSGMWAVPKRVVYEDLLRVDLRFTVHAIFFPCTLKMDSIYLILACRYFEDFSKHQTFLFIPSLSNLISSLIFVGSFHQRWLSCHLTHFLGYIIFIDI